MSADTTAGGTADDTGGAPGAPVSAAGGRVVLVTGGSRGIGLACARHFQARGDRVAVTYRSSPPPPARA
ncbi:MAG: SDR family NAD(P)-dependent oxidoreductase, partial [Acidimicrobiales bacterium]